MKLRRINRILTDPKQLPCSEEDLLHYANTLGYVLPGGGTPWDADTMTVRTLGPGKTNPDFTAAFAPDDTITPWQGPSRRNEWETAWPWIGGTVPGPGERAVHGTVSYQGRTAAVEVEACRDIRDGYRIYVNGAILMNQITEGPREFDSYGAAVYQADLETTNLGRSLVARQ